VLSADQANGMCGNNAKSFDLIAKVLGPCILSRCFRNNTYIFMVFGCTFGF